VRDRVRTHEFGFVRERDAVLGEPPRRVRGSVEAPDPPRRIFERRLHRMPAVENDGAVAGGTRLAAARRTTARDLALPPGSLWVVRVGWLRTALAHGISLPRERPVRRRQDQDIGGVFSAGAGGCGAVDTAQRAAHNPARPTHPRGCEVRGSVPSGKGGGL